MSDEIEQIKTAAGGNKKYALEAKKDFIDLRLRQDIEIRDMYIRFTDRLAARVKNMVIDTPSAKRRKEQLETFEAQLKKEAGLLVDNLKDGMEKYISKGVSIGSSYSKAVTFDILDKANVRLPKMEATFDRVNKKAAEACWLRTKKGFHLTDRIWVQGEKAQQAIRDIFQEAVITGQDAITTARLLEQYVRTDAKTLVQDYPELMKRLQGNIPGDLSYEALRLARTETTAAYGEGRLRAARLNPNNIGMRWILSPSHPAYDICNEYARNDDGLGIGVFALDDVPAYPPHPNCICDLIEITGDTDNLVDRLKKWYKGTADDPELDNWYNAVYKPVMEPQVKHGFLHIENNDAFFNAAGDISKVGEELGLIPEAHRKLLQEHNVIVQTGYEFSGYERAKGIIQIGKGPEPGEVIHEVGHAVETIKDLYNDKEFLAILESGIPADEIGTRHLAISLYSSQQVILLDHPDIVKFISDYQARVYTRNGIGDSDLFIEKEEKQVFNVKRLGEYFSEGYKWYIMNPDDLLEKDPLLYSFIKRMIENGQ